MTVNILMNLHRIARNRIIMPKGGRHDEILRDAALDIEMPLDEIFV